MTDAGPNVLVVDDEVQIRRFLRSGFELDGYAVSEAESGQVWFPVAEEAPPAPEAVEPPPAPFKTFDEAQIFSIVHQVVAKMSPPVLSPQMVEDIARRFADELIQDFNSQP